MVQQLFNSVEHLKAEVRRLRGELNAISSGGRVIPTSISGGGGVQLPLPISGAILYGTGVPEWARLAPGTNGEILTLVAGFPSWEANASAGDIETFPTSETDDTLVLAPDGLGGVEWVTAPAGTPSGTVTDETTYGITPAAGASNDYSRGDHTHGSPPAAINLNPDDPPGSPDAMDDEFTGGGALDAQWTLVNDPAGANALNQTDFSGYLHVGLIENTGTDNLAARVQMYQTPPTGTQTLAWVAKVALTISVDAFQTEKGEFAAVMLYLMNNANSEYVSIKINISNLLETNGTIGFASSEKTADAAFASNFGPALDLSGWYYLKLVKSTANAYTAANTYNAYISKNGVIWHLVGTDSITFTANCDRVGLMFRRPKSQNGSPTAEVIVDYFRRTD